MELDAQRNRNREALRQLHKLSKSPGGLGDKSWICLGSTFIKIRSKQCVDMLEKGEHVLIVVGMYTFLLVSCLSDQNVLDDAIDSLHRGLKDKVSALNEMEGEWSLRCCLFPPSIKLPSLYFLPSLYVDCCVYSVRSPQ